MLGGEEFSPRHPLAGLGPGRQEREVRFRLAGVVADRIQLVTSLHGAAEILQDTEVARVTVEATTGPPLTFRLRAGRETAERLHDERVAHVQPAPHLSAWSLVDRRSEGAFYLARFAWPGTRRLVSLRIRYTAGRGRLLLFGGTVGGSEPGVVSLSPFMREGYRPVREEAGAVLYENERARPRAFAVHRIVVASTPREAIRRLATGEVRPEEAVVLEDPTAPATAGAGPSVVSIQIDEPLRVELLATMKGDGYVVLADTIYPGWRATVDGVEAPIFAANGLFRAVCRQGRLPPRAVRVPAPSSPSRSRHHRGHRGPGRGPRARVESASLLISARLSSPSDLTTQLNNSRAPELGSGAPD